MLIKYEDIVQYADVFFITLYNMPKAKAIGLFWEAY